VSEQTGSAGGDDRTTLGDLKREVLLFARERNWEQFHTPKNLSMALAAEAGELMEHFLWTSGEESREQAGREAVADELADILLYAMEFANVAGIDVARAIRNKMAKNGVKYPVEKAWGNALKYTEFEKRDS
jgi:dCTP diphosphatase